ncbi:MAG: acyl-CoA dehydrogenase family protein [Thermoanaerobaculia bacterium]
MAYDPLSPATVAPFLEPDRAPDLEAARRFACERLRPRPVPADDAAARREARELLVLLGAAGWLREAIPAAWGGARAAVSVRALCALREAAGEASPLADAVLALQALGATPIALAGEESLRRRWLPEVAAGRAMAAFAMTEPEAGSDVAALATTARRDGADYVLDGRKWLISNAGIADFYSVFASTDRAAGSRGVSCFLVPAGTAGLRFVGAQVLSEPHPLGEIALESCRVPADHRLGGEGEGFKLGMRTLDRLRATVAAAACGMAGRALAEALAHAASRRQGDGALADLQLVQAKLAAMATELEAARLLTWRAAWEIDRGAGRGTREVAMAKLFATEAAQRVVDQAVQILGGRGVLAESITDRLYRAVRALRIYEGTSEIQHLVIARQILR